MAYLLDTNTISFVLDGNLRVTQRLLAVSESEPMHASVVTEGELRYGALKMGRAGRRDLLDQIEWVLGELVEVLPASRSIAATYARIKRDVELAGKPMSISDLWIGATALDAEAVLVTSDRAFTRIPGLQVEDWLEPI